MQNYLKLCITYGLTIGKLDNMPDVVLILLFYCNDHEDFGNSRCNFSINDS